MMRVINALRSGGTSKWPLLSNLRNQNQVELWMQQC